jgi:hypothetical protein
VSDSLGKFRNRDLKDTGVHQKAEEKDRDNYPLPDSIVYQVPPDIADTLNPQSQHAVDPQGTSTLVQKEVGTLIYMDVGRWSGSAPTKHDTQSHWGRRRDFGIVHGRLAALCTYTVEPSRDEKDEVVLDAVENSIQSATEFKEIVSLLKILSSNPELGRVQVTKAVLGRKLNNEIPKEDRIYVILGDLHAPVMTNPQRTYSDEPQHKSLADTGMAVQSIPGGYASAALASGVLKRGPLHEWRGRYDPGVLASDGLPSVARGLGESAKAIVKANPIAIYAAEAQAVTEAPATTAALITVGGAVSAVLIEIAAKARLREWPDSEGGHAENVRAWFDRYHGTRDKKGADIFEDAGADLLLWLKLLKDYQETEGSNLPVRLMQLGDLFDFWIGLKCPFDIFAGAKTFPNQAAAWEFVKYWMDQTLEAPAIKYLWNFDKHAPMTRPDLKTVFLYGNHDTYMGSLPPKHERLNERFEDDPGLVAQHGHQEDTFNKESNAAFGYLLTQAAFSDDYVRTIEDPMSALGPTLYGGNWTRLDLAEMALKTCVFDRVNSGKKPAMTFVMGHTHEPVLQVIHVVASHENKSRATSTSTGTATSTSTSSSTATATSTSTSTGQSRDTSTKTR